MVNNTLQWTGALFVIAGHILNSIGGMDPYNIIVFLFGTIMFLTWAIRVKNKPQTVVNMVSITVCMLGIARAII